MNCLHQQNMKYNAIIFDFDGTIADTSEGIIDAHVYALKFMGKKVPPTEEIYNLIGGQLLKIYNEIFDFPLQKAHSAIEIYRKRYAEVGIHKATLYPDFQSVLKTLKSRGFKIGLATLKAETFAKIMLEELDIIQYFDCICGMDLNDTLTKADLIIKCLNNLQCGSEEALFVGDSEPDLQGALKVGVEFLGVTYGFGFKKNEKYDFKTIDNCSELLAIT